MSMNDRKAVRRFKHAGFDCALIDSEIGFINGYVRLTENHVGYGGTYDRLNRAIVVHGGLTYGPDEDGWVGFDTGHAGDYWPGMDERLRFGSVERPWNLNLLVAEVESLADQLAALTAIPDPESPWDCTEEEFAALLRDAKAWRESQEVATS